MKTPKGYQLRESNWRNLIVYDHLINPTTVSVTCPASFPLEHYIVDIHNGNRYLVSHKTFTDKRKAFEFMDNWMQDHPDG